MKNYEKYQRVQQIAKETIKYLTNFVEAGVTEKEIVTVAENHMIEKGIDKFWYHNVGAFVFVGDRTTLSISGREYLATDKEVENNDIITIDLSPEKNGYWGDFARTLIIGEGKCMGTNIEEITGKTSSVRDFIEGIRTEELLHKEFVKNVDYRKTFEEVFLLMNDKIEDYGYENLDFLKNLGHTIETDQSKRIYFEKGNKTQLKDVKLFTFEPHIRKPNSSYGFKREDIYYFKDNKLLQV